MTTATQTRGHCQMCGRQQAVRNGIAAHGYTVANGWFQGVCQGHRYAPLEKRRAETDSMVADVLKEAYDLRIKAAETLEGKHDPVEYEVRKQWIDRKWVPTMAPFVDAPEHKKQQIRKERAWSMTRRAESGESFANMMSALADKVHGTELVVVAKPQAAERIQAGDKRVNNIGTVLTAVRQDGQRLYFSYTRETDGRVLTTWMSPRSWRVLQAA